MFTIFFWFFLSFGKAKGGTGAGEDEVFFFVFFNQFSYYSFSMFVFFAKGPKNYLYMMFSFFFGFPISPFSFVTWSCHPLFCVFSYELFLRMTSISWGVGDWNLYSQEFSRAA